MKISWPWRRSKPFSLFDNQIPPDDGFCQPASDFSGTYTGQRPLNAPGPFYVVNQDCMACGYPHVLAPDLMAWKMNSEGREIHCYFHKQPETPREIEQAVNAVKGSCCGALCYSGSDAEITKCIS